MVAYECDECEREFTVNECLDCQFCDRTLCPTCNDAHYCEEEEEISR